MGKDTEDYILEEIVEIGKNLDNWKFSTNTDMHGHTCRKYYVSHKDTLSINLELLYKNQIPFFEKKLNGYKISAGYDCRHIGEYLIKKKNPRFEKVKELHEYIEESIRKKKEKIRLDALKDAKKMIMKNLSQ